LWRFFDALFPVYKMKSESYTKSGGQLLKSRRKLEFRAREGWLTDPDLSR